MKNIWKPLDQVIQFMNKCALLILVATGASITSVCGQPYVKADHISWSVIYDYGIMSPAVVYYELQASDFRGSLSDKVKHFRMDYLLPPPHVKNSSFAFSGYQRGHLCPSGDRDSRKSWFKDTYFTSNVLPMTADCNAGAWKDTELKCRKQCVSGCKLKIACGGIDYKPIQDEIDGSILMVPDSVWKIACCEVHSGERWCWIIPNARRARGANYYIRNPTDLYDRLPTIISNYLQAWIQK